MDVRRGCDRITSAMASNGNQIKWIEILRLEWVRWPDFFSSMRASALIPLKHTHTHTNTQAHTKPHTSKKSYGTANVWCVLNRTVTISSDRIQHTMPVTVSWATTATGLGWPPDRHTPNVQWVDWVFAKRQIYTSIELDNTSTRRPTHPRTVIWIVHLPDDRFEWQCST